MADNSVDIQNFKVEDIEAAIKEEQRTPGGMKMNIILSPAVSKSAPTPQSHTSSPHSQAEIDERMSAAAARREKLDQLRQKNIASQLARVDDAKNKREEKTTEKTIKSKEALDNKQETQERNRIAQLQIQKDKVAEKLAKVERQHKQLEIQTEAARLAAECTLNVKLTKADEKRQEHLEEMMKRLKEHEENVAKVRESHERLFSDDKTKWRQN